MLKFRYAPALLFGAAVAAAAAATAEKTCSAKLPEKPLGGAALLMKDSTRSKRRVVNEDLDENVGEDLDEVLDEDLDEDLEGADSSDVLQTVKDTRKNEACTPCQFELFSEENCAGEVAQAIDLECENLDSFPDCVTEHDVAEGASVVSIKGTRKGCGIQLFDENGERQRFAKQFAGCVNIDTKDGGFSPIRMKTRDRVLCKPRRKRRR